MDTAFSGVEARRAIAAEEEALAVAAAAEAADGELASILHFCNNDSLGGKNFYTSYHG